MDNGSSNKTADCWSLQAVASRLNSDHVYPAPAVDPPLHVTHWRWAFSSNFGSVCFPELISLPLVSSFHCIYLPSQQPSSFQQTCMSTSTTMSMMSVRSQRLWTVRLQSASEADTSLTQRQEHKMCQKKHCFFNLLSSIKKEFSGIWVEQFK